MEDVEEVRGPVVALFLLSLLLYEDVHYATFFFDGAILQREVHVFAHVATTRLNAESCTANG
jgi:hypothetical protein